MTRASGGLAVCTALPLCYRAPGTIKLEPLHKLCCNAAGFHLWPPLTSSLCVPTLCPQATLSRREAVGQQPALNLSPVLKNRRPPAPAGLLHRSQLGRTPEHCCGAVRVGPFHSMCSKLLRSLAVVAHLRAAQPGEKCCYDFAPHASVSEPPCFSVCTYAGLQRSSCRCSSVLRSAYVFPPLK